MIIGLAGAKESGKNTAARMINELFSDDYEVKEWSFAAKLKQSAVAALTGHVVPIEEAIEHCDWIKEHGIIRVDKGLEPMGKISGRQFLQWYGTEAHREIFGKDFWIDIVMNQIPNPITELGTKEEWNSRIDVITDIRFPNEAIAVRSHGGKVLRINRPSIGEGDSHASEKPLENYLVWGEISNKGSLNDLRQKILPTVKFAMQQMRTDDAVYSY